MSAWEETSLSELGVIKMGRKTHKPASDPVLFENGTIPFVQVWCVNGGLFVNNIEKYYNEVGLKQSRLFSANTVCITNNSSIGDTSILKEGSCLADTLFGFNSFKDISDPKFVKYCFDFSKIKKLCQYVASANTGTKSLTRERLSTIPFPNPPLDIQQKIGRILSTYDLLIENYEKQIDLLKNQRTKLFQRWFINHKFPNYIDTNLLNWKEVKFKDIVQISKGKLSADFEDPKGKYPFFTSSIDSPKRTNSYSYDTTAILVTSARHFIANYYSGKFEVSNGSYVVTFKHLNLSMFLLEIMNNFLPLMQTQTSTTSYPQLRKSTFEKIEISLPPDNLLNLFNKFAEPIQKQIDNLINQINIFQTVKSTLIERIYSQNLTII